ncbi:MAG TPA: hypothetical protein VMT52_02725 [Planctomycetota bacterium]|nr:hypothetical protein [Planctomycetota bacterium]
MTILVAVLACLQADPAVAEESGLLKYRRPVDWQSTPLSDGSRLITPVDGSGAMLRLLAPEAWDREPAEFHEAVLAALRMNGTILSAGKAERRGAFLRSELVFASAGGQNSWICLYVAKAGDRCQATLFMAPSAELFARHQKAADDIILSADLPEARERASGFELTMPKGWKRQDDPAQGVALFPGNLPVGTCRVVVLPARETPSTAEEHHEQMWTALTANSTPLEKPARSEKGLFLSTRVRMRKADGKLAWLILYTAKRGSTAETLFFAASAEEHFKRHAAEADALVEGISFPAPAASAPSGRSGPWKPTPIPAAKRDVKMVGLWIHGSTNLEYGYDGGGTFSTRMRSRIETLGLWENGLAFRGVHNAPITPNGLLMVQEGLAVIDAAAVAGAAKFEDDRFGRWTEGGDVVEIPKLRDGGLTLTRAGRNFTDQAGEKWIWLAPVDRARLEGTFVGAETVAAPEMRLTLRKDGTFEAVNVIHAVGGPSNNPDFPAAGKGTYEFRKWSLILRFESGFAQALRFYGSGDSLADAKGLVLNGSDFVRR